MVPVYQFSGFSHRIAASQWGPPGDDRFGSRGMVGASPARQKYITYLTESLQRRKRAVSAKKPKSAYLIIDDLVGAKLCMWHLTFIR